MIYDREYEGTSLTDFLYDPEKFFMQPDIVFLKKGRSATVIKVMLGDRTWVVKRYNIKNGWHWLRRCVRATRAATSWRLAQRLRLFGISTAKPVAYVENKFCGLRGKSYFVMEYVAGQHVGEFFSDCNKDEECLSTMAVSVVNMLNQLRELKITHGDLKMTNILVADKGSVLIDLDGMREHAGKFKFKQAATAEIERFMRNWYNDPRAAAVFRALL
jgi:tRNA A-37 threonylcarbamoyl transferase component Bud32